MHILGISFGIDTSACLLRDGVLIGASLEERFSRIKHDRAWPRRAIAWCLREGGITLPEVDRVAFFWNPALQLDHPHAGRSHRYGHHGDYLHMAPSWLLDAFRPPAAGRIDSPWMSQQITLEGRDRPLVIDYISHHRCHAASAFFPSPFAKAAVLIVDGYGERAATTLGAYETSADGRATYLPLLSLDFPNSLGAFYAAITEYLGFRANNGEGKVMGLAPYGGTELIPRFAALLGLDADRSGLYELDLRFFRFHLPGPGRISRRFIDEFGPPARPGEPHQPHHLAVAHAAQAVTEQALLKLAMRAHQLSGKRDLVIAGGVAMNSAANGRIEREGPFSRLWVQPAAGDGGTAIGAALTVWHELLGESRRERWLLDRSGPSFSAEQCRAALSKGGWSWTEPEDLCVDTAAALARGELVGWFQGRAELGMRALGGRSILADPRAARTKDVLNERVKFREPFRPFAPSVLQEEARRWFDLPAGAQDWAPVPFMQKVHPVRKEHRQTLAAVTHVDGSARLQTVSRQADPLYHGLIAAFGAQTGVPVLLNTSFNVRGEPIVGTPDDAIRCWATTGLDRLVLGPCVLHKPGANGATRQP